jgi:hypothetical protein
VLQYVHKIRLVESLSAGEVGHVHQELLQNLKGKKKTHEKTTEKKRCVSFFGRGQTCKPQSATFRIVCLKAQMMASITSLNCGAGMLKKALKHSLFTAWNGEKDRFSLNA